ncbi:hypothetical protein PHET_05080 [Paragonimus heterotremus]|uniref:Uncharacterized protein n=1 Tax=Paragonimus heterotremus TaxID=100268 RepID=A0A8J4WRM9_9TREM|nr:hypothetical protein PHET_05080 [Paragonimus heterotremus]
MTKHGKRPLPKIDDDVGQTEKSVKPKKNSKSQRISTVNRNMEMKEIKPVDRKDDLISDLRTLKKDITEVPCQHKKREFDNTKLVSAAEKVLIPPRQGGETLELNVNRDSQTIYIEKHLGFQAESIDQFERRWNEKHQALQEAALHTDSLERSSPGLHFALNIHRAFRNIGLTILGLLAGASLVHTLFIRTFSNTKTVDASGLVRTEWDNGALLVIRYGPYAKSVAIAYYICFMITGGFILDRFDFAHITPKCVQQCVTLSNGAFAVIFFWIAFIFNNAMMWFDHQLDNMAYTPVDELLPTLTTNADYTRTFEIWRVLDICRTTFVILTWVVIGFSPAGYDRLKQSLYLDPSRSDREAMSDVTHQIEY